MPSFSRLFEILVARWPLSKCPDPDYDCILRGINDIASLGFGMLCRPEGSSIGGSAC